MTEHKVTEHALKSYKIINNPTLSWKKKVWDILVEMSIIIFAVIITLYFERLREHSQDKKIQEEFLAAYKYDLLSDIRELRNDSAGYHAIQQKLLYILEAKTPNPDSLKKIILPLVFQTIDFVPKNSRFEALKAAGKLNAIDDRDLLNGMFELYQKDLPYFRIFGPASLNDYRNLVTPYIQLKMKRDKNNKVINMEELVNDPVIINYLNLWLSKTYEIKAQYHTVIVKYQQLYSTIEKKS